jgi:hypothetical protein
MIPPVVFAAGTAMLMGGLLLEVCILRAIDGDLPSTYKLFALRDKLLRLVVEGKIERHEPHFEALYRNVNILLTGCRHLSGAAGWRAAEVAGRRLALYASDEAALSEIPSGAIPDALEPVLNELRAALVHVTDSRVGLVGLILMVDARRRELARMHKERAKQFLKMMPGGALPA